MVLFCFPHRVSHCFTDSTHSNVFAFVTASGQTMSECHAFMCSKRKMVRSSLSDQRYGNNPQPRMTSSPFSLRTIYSIFILFYFFIFFVSIYRRHKICQLLSVNRLALFRTYGRNTTNTNRKPNWKHQKQFQILFKVNSR